MKSQRTPGAKALSFIPFISLIAILGGLFMAFKPKPTPRAELAKARQERLSIHEKTAALRTQLETVTSTVAARIWIGTPDEVENRAMARVNSLARESGLRIIAFRPQRRTELEGLGSQPFVLAVEGKFPAVVGFASRLGTPDTKLAVTQLQVSSADAASDTVNATLGISAYRQLNPVGEAKN